jgi:translation initiation factor IF-3
VPVPRRFDRRPPDRDTTRINDRIRVPEVRLVGEDGKQIGVVKTSDALAYAQERDLDLVEVAPDARPPVCRVLDYSKYKYEQAQKQKAARKHQQQITIREIKFRPKIAQNDYDTKKGHVTRFLRGHDKVKITIMFRGREVTHPERGTALLDRLAGELADIAVIEQSPLQDGRNMTMLLAPSKAVLAEERGAKPAVAEDKPGENGAGPSEAAEAAPAADAGPSGDDAPTADAPPTADTEPAPAAAEKPPRAAKAATAKKTPVDGQDGAAENAAAADPATAGDAAA